MWKIIDGKTCHYIVNELSLCGKKTEFGYKDKKPFSKNCKTCLKVLETYGTTDNLLFRKHAEVRIDRF